MHEAKYLFNRPLTHILPIAIAVDNKSAKYAAILLEKILLQANTDYSRLRGKSNPLIPQSFWQARASAPPLFACQSQFYFRGHEGEDYLSPLLDSQIERPRKLTALEEINKVYYEIHFLTNNLSKEHEENLSSMVSFHPCVKVCFHRGETLLGTDLSQEGSSKVSTNSFFARLKARSNFYGNAYTPLLALFLPELLASYERVLYLDLNLDLGQDLQRLLDLDFEGSLVAGVLDEEGEEEIESFSNNFQDKDISNLIPLKTKYSPLLPGVFLFNIKACQNNEFTLHALKHASLDKDLFTVKEASVLLALLINRSLQDYVKEGYIKRELEADSASRSEQTLEQFSTSPTSPTSNISTYKITKNNHETGNTPQQIIQENSTNEKISFASQKGNSDSSQKTSTASKILSSEFNCGNNNLEAFYQSKGLSLRHSNLGLRGNLITSSDNKKYLDESSVLSDFAKGLLSNKNYYLWRYPDNPFLTKKVSHPWLYLKDAFFTPYAEELFNIYTEKLNLLERIGFWWQSKRLLKAYNKHYLNPYQSALESKVRPLEVMALASDTGTSALIDLLSKLRDDLDSYLEEVAKLTKGDGFDPRFPLTKYFNNNKAGAKNTPALLYLFYYPEDEEEDAYQEKDFMRKVSFMVNIHIHFIPLDRNLPTEVFSAVYQHSKDALAHKEEFLANQDKAKIEESNQEDEKVTNKVNVNKENTADIETKIDIETKEKQVERKPSPPCPFLKVADEQLFSNLGPYLYFKEVFWLAVKEKKEDSSTIFDEDNF